MNSAKQARRRRVGLASALRRNFAPQLLVFCGIQLLEVEAQAASLSESIRYEMVRWKYTSRVLRC